MKKSFTTKSSEDSLSNYLRIHRRRAGISQHELGKIVGYEDGGSVARHEKRLALPPLLIALGYEAVFQVPASEIFPGIRRTVETGVEERLAEFENSLRERSGYGVEASATARKLEWLNERRNFGYH